MSFSIELELEDGGTVTYDNVISFTAEETQTAMPEVVEVEEDAIISPDEVPEDGDAEREGGSEVDLSEEEEQTKNPMDEVEETA